MKNLISIFTFIATFHFSYSQVVITDKTTPNIDPSAILKLDSDTKGVLFPRISLNSNTDITTIPNPQDGNTVFNIKNSSTLPPTVTFFANKKWNYIYNKEQAQTQLDLVSSNALVSPGNIIITGYTPGPINLGTDTTGWVSLGITDNKSFSRANNSLAFTVEGMTQLDKSSSQFYEYAIGIFVDNKLAVVRKYHKINEPSVTCSWHKFILNGVINNLSIGNHTIKVMARNISSTSNSPTQSIVYGGVANSSITDYPACPNMSNFLSKITLSTTIVESIN